MSQQKKGMIKKGFNTSNMNINKNVRAIDVSSSLSSLDQNLNEQPHAEIHKTVPTVSSLISQDDIGSINQMDANTNNLLQQISTSNLDFDLPVSNNLVGNVNNMVPVQSTQSYLNFDNEVASLFDNQIAQNTYNQNQQSQPTYSPISIGSSGVKPTIDFSLTIQNQLFQMCGELAAKCQSQSIELINSQERYKTQQMFIAQLTSYHQTQLELKDKINSELNELNNNLKFRINRLELEKISSKSGFFNVFGEEPEFENDDDDDKEYCVARKKFLQDCGDKREKVLKHVDELQNMCHGMKLKSMLYKILVDFQTNAKEHNRDSKLKFYTLANN